MLIKDHYFRPKNHNWYF